MAVNALLFLYLAVYVKYFKQNKSDSGSDELINPRPWEESHPHVIHIGAVAAVVSTVSFIVAWWPVFHLLSIGIVVSIQLISATGWKFSNFAELSQANPSTYI